MCSYLYFLAKILLYGLLATCVGFVIAKLMKYNLQDNLGYFIANSIVTCLALSLMLYYLPYNYLPYDLTSYSDKCGMVIGLILFINVIVYFIMKKQGCIIVDTEIVCNNVLQ